MCLGQESMHFKLTCVLLAVFHLSLVSVCEPWDVDKVVLNTVLAVQWDLYSFSFFSQMSYWSQLSRDLHIPNTDVSRRYKAGKRFLFIKCEQLVFKIASLRVKHDSPSFKNNCALLLLLKEPEGIASLLRKILVCLCTVFSLALSGQHSAS